MKGKDLNKRLKQLKSMNKSDAEKLTELLDPNIPLPKIHLEFWEWYYNKWKQQNEPTNNIGNEFNPVKQ